MGRELAVAGLLVGAWLNEGLGVEDILQIGDDPAKYRAWAEAGTRGATGILDVIEGIFGTDISAKVFFLRLVAALQEKVETPPSPFNGWADFAGAVAATMKQDFPVVVELMP